MSDWCFTSLSTIFQLYHDGGCLLHETRYALGFLSAANTDAPCRRHKTRIHHPVTLSGHRAIQSWFYPLNAERLARKQLVPIFTPLVWCGRRSSPRPPDYKANALPARPPCRSYMYELKRFMFLTIRLIMERGTHIILYEASVYRAV